MKIGQSQQDRMASHWSVQYMEKGSKMEFLVITIILLIALTIWVIRTYNELQEKKQSIIEQSSNIQVSLQKRRDLASRIIDIAKGFDEHEKLTHLKVLSTQETSTTELSALAQSFPELKANETYGQLMKQLEELEHYISQKREAYNGTVKLYNSYRGRFPNMLVANKLNFDGAPYYDVEDEDSLQKLASFNRDDAKAVKDLVENSKANIKNSAQKLKERTNEQISDVKNSDTFKAAVQQGEEAVSKVIEAAKNKATEYSKEKMDDSSSGTTKT